MKFFLRDHGHDAGSVAPYTGAWIEMLYVIHYRNWIIVAPYTGAWIEIRTYAMCKNTNLRRSLYRSVD